MNKSKQLFEAWFLTIFFGSLLLCFIMIIDDNFSSKIIFESLFSFFLFIFWGVVISSPFFLLMLYTYNMIERHVKKHQLTLYFTFYGFASLIIIYLTEFLATPFIIVGIYFQYKALKKILSDSTLTP